MEADFAAGFLAAGKPGKRGRAVKRGFGVIAGLYVNTEACFGWLNGNKREEKFRETVSVHG